MDNIGIGIRAIGDFSDVERAAAEAAQRTNRHFADVGKVSHQQGMLARMLAGKDATKGSDVTKMFDSVRVALEKTHQSGKKLKDLRFSDDFKDAAKHIADMQAGMDRLARTDFGRDVRRRARLSGQDPSQPWSWDWQRMGYSNPESAQRRLMGALGPAAGHGGSGVGRAIAGSLGRTAVGLAEAASGGSGLGSAAGAIGGAAMMGPAGIAAIAAATLGAIGVKAYMVRAASFGSDNALSKASGGGFDAVHTETLDLADSLHMAVDAAGKLRESFMRASGSIDEGTAGRVGAAGQFGRGYGIDPATAAMQFAGAELVGYGKTKTDQRDFAGTIAKTVAGSGMFGRVEQIMGDLVAHIGGIASTQNRTANKEEVGAYANMLEIAYGKDANRGGGATSLFDAIGRIGGGGSDTLESIAWGAYGGAIGGDLGKFETFKEAPLSASAHSLFGSGSKKTKMELLHDYVQTYLAPGMPTEGADEQFALALKKSGGATTMGQGREYARIMRELKAGGGSYSDVIDWASATTGTAPGDIPMGGLNNLSRLWKTRGDSLSSQSGMLTEMGATYQHSKRLPKDIAEELDSAMKKTGDERAAALREVLPKAVLSVRDTNNPYDVHTGVAAAADSAMDKMGEAGKVIVDGAWNAAHSLKELADTMAGPDGLLVKMRALGDAIGEIPGVQGALDKAKAAARAIGGALIGDAEASIPSTAATYTPTAKGIKGILDVIAQGESGGRLDAVQGDKGTSPMPGLPKMSVRDVLDWQYKSGSGAVGAHQFEYPTLKRHAEKLGLMDAPFDAATQDKLAAQELIEAGSAKWQTGGMSDADFQAGIAKKFRAIPSDGSGISTSGRVAPVSHGDIVKALREGRSRIAGGALIGGDSPDMEGVDPALRAGLELAAKANPQWKIKVTDGMRQGGLPNHRGGHAVDFKIFDEDGKEIPNVGVGGRAARAYEKVSQDALALGSEIDPTLKDRLRWGGYFRGGSTPKDLMHLDVTPGAPRPGGALAGSQNPLVKGASPDFNTGEGRWSRGMRGGTIESHRDDLLRTHPELLQEIDRMKGGSRGDPVPVDLAPTLSGATSMASPSAKLEGSIALDVVFRDSRGGVIQRRQGLAVSEPRLPGTGGSREDASRFTWKDTVTMPGLA